MKLLNSNKNLNSNFNTIFVLNTIADELFEIIYCLMDVFNTNLEKRNFNLK